MQSHMRRKGFTLWELIAILAIIVITAAVLFPVLHVHRGSGRSSCINHLKQMGIALTQYNQDYDERYPLIVLTPVSDVLTVTPTSNESCYYGWADSIFPYLKSPTIYHCPTQTQKTNKTPSLSPLARNFTDYWLNTNLNGLSLKSAVTANADNIIALGDGNDGGDMTDARYNLLALPAPWLNDQESPCYRHLGSAMYCFLDGHVKTLTPDKITNRPPGNKQPTFAVK